MLFLLSTVFCQLQTGFIITPAPNHQQQCMCWLPNQELQTNFRSHSNLIFLNQLLFNVLFFLSANNKMADRVELTMHPLQHFHNLKRWCSLEIKMKI